MKFSNESDKPSNANYRPGEVHLHIRFRPTNVFGVLLVILIHGLLLFYLLQVRTPQKQGDDAGSTAPINFILNKVAQKQQAAPTVKPITPTQPSIKSAATPKIPRTPLVTYLDTPNPDAPQATPELDMSAMLNANRAKRQQLEAVAAQENEAAQAAQTPGRGMSPQEAAEANVRRSMAQANGRSGSGGLFTILSKSTRTATISFRGWKTGMTNSGRQTYEVDAGLGGNIELAIIKRVIEIIRMQYSGDVPWDSSRLGRVVNISARPQDNIETETFLMKEFFDSNR